MRVKPSISIALIVTLLLIGQAMTSHLNQIPGESEETTLEPTALIMASNNTTDTDGDGVYDVYDDCANGATNWTSSPSTDYDSDGCRDAGEDSDDDNDGVSDSYDSCPSGALGWISTSSTDYDSDGCKDSTEDTDDDNDGVVDGYDSCPKGDLGWTSSPSTDADGDGCRDSTEDSDGGGNNGNNSGNNSGGNNSGGNNSGGNNSGGNNTMWEYIIAWSNSMNYSSSSDINLNWSAGELDNNNNVTYNVTVDIYGMVNNNTSIVWSSWSAFSPALNSTSGWFTIPANTLSTGCYFASFDISDDDDGMIFDYDGFNFGVNINCSNNGGNNSGGNNSGGNNSGGGCGADVAYTSVHAYGPYYGFVNQPFMTSMYVHCEIYNSNMMLDYWIYDAQNYTVDSGNQSWTGTSTMSSTNYNWSVGGLSAGNYTFHVDLYVNGTLVDSDNDPFMVMANNNGGNNSGGNNTGGNNTGGNNTGGNNTGGNNTGGNNTGGNNTGGNNTADSDGDGYPDWCEQYWGTDPLEPTDFPTQLQDCNNNTGNNTGGNNTGGNNTGGNNSGGNNSGGNNNTHGAMFVYIQSGTHGFGIAEQFPLSLHFPAPPMSDNSPYALSQICSVNNGHTVNVFATWVYSEGGNAGDFNNITSWSVKNSNGLQLDHFSYNPMSDIIGFTNPMVVFEDDANWSGHIPAEVFDQAAWACVNSASGGNNSGGNNSGGNNSGGNNSGNNTVTPNTPPVVSNVSISPTLTTVDDTLTCEYDIYDGDGDATVATTTWSVNGNIILTGEDSLSNGFSVGDDVSCSVTATDGQQPSNAVSSSTVILPAPTTEEPPVSEGLPALGTVGTMAAIIAGIFASRRKDE